MAANKKSMTMDDFKKHHFWVVAGGAVVVCLVCWFLATGKLKKDTKENLGEIDSTFKRVVGVQQEIDHPNPTTHDKMKAEWTRHRDQTHEAWKRQFESQKQTLVWMPRLQAYTQNMLPVEKKVEFPPGDQIARPVRLAARRYLVEYLPTLATIIGSKWDPKGEQESDAGADTTSTEGASRPNGKVEDKSIITWAAPDQNKLLARYKFGTDVPSTLDVLYAQEDIWVIQALLQAIKNANGSATTRSRAVVREIMAIDIANEVQGMLAVGKVLDETGKGGAGNMGGGGGGAGGGAPAIDMSGMMEAMSGGSDSEDEGEEGEEDAVSKDPAENRYVDNDGKPVTAERLRQAYSSKQANDAFLAVAKRIPVRFRVKMDYHKIPLLITQCGNSKLPIWIRQVRVNTAAGTGAGGAGGGSNMMTQNLEADGPKTGNMMEMMMNMGKGGAKGGTRRVAPETFPFQQEVEFYGVVYIYNPPDKDILGIVETDDADDGEGDDQGGNTPDDADKKNT